MKRILITGANSYVGTNVESWLMQKPEKYQVDTLDMIDNSWRNKDFSGYDVVCHVAGIAHVNAKKNMKALYYMVNKDLAIETAQHSKQCNVKQFIFMSSIIVYGESRSLKPIVITKTTNPRPNGFYGNSKLLAEIGIKEQEDDQFKVAILRPPMIYGPGAKGNFPRLIAFAKKALFFPAYNNQRSMLYIDNLCEFIKLVIDNEDRGTFWPQNREYVNTSEFIRLIAKSYGKKIYLVKGFPWIIKLLSHIFKIINKALGSQTYEKELSKYKQEYQLVGLQESIMRVKNLSAL